MIRSLRIGIFFFLVLALPPALSIKALAQSSGSESTSSAQPGHGVQVGYGAVDSSFVERLWQGLQRAGSLHSMLLDRWNAIDTTLDTTKDSLVFEFGKKGVYRRHRSQVYTLTELEDPRQFQYLEPFSMMDFNRVDGFFLGLGSSGMVDFGPHDEFGMNGGGGYGFADKRWQYFLGGEFRLPLGKVRHEENDTTLGIRLFAPPTLAIGAEFHNQTSTDDAWRAGRMENAAYSFFAREDFRDYYKVAGYSAYLVFRPSRHHEFKVQWRSDNYEDRAQTVFYGRWGGNKVLPPNPAISEGHLNSLVFTGQEETVRERNRRESNIFGDSVNFEQLRGESDVVQAELGHMPGSDSGYNRYLFDFRHFQPITSFLAFDSRFRFQATTGDNVLQKLEYLGGPGSLPALKNKIAGGNRLILLNTEIRFNLAELSKIFGGDLQLVWLNDFGYVGYTHESSIIAGFSDPSSSPIIYNVGGAIGWNQGIQVGATWRTDIKENPRLIFRLQRAF